MIEDLFDTATEWGFNQLRDTSLGIVESMLALSLLVLNPLFPAIATPLSASFRLLVMGVYGLAVCIGGVLVMTNESLQERYSARGIIPRLIAGFVLAYYSSTIIWFIQDLNVDMVTAFTLGDVLGESEYGGSFVELLIIEARSAPITLIDLVIAVFKLVAAFMLWLCMLTRNIAWLLVAMFAPIGLAAHGLPFTEGLAWLWWRMLWACFFSSVGQAALVWAWMHLYDDLDDVEVLAYYSMGPFYMLVLTWVAWRLHKDLFIWAKGSPLRLPGSRLAKALVGATVGTALFRANPVGRLAGRGWQAFQQWRGQGQQPPQVPPVPPPLRSSPLPARPRTPSTGRRALGRAPFIAGATADVPPHRRGQGPAASEQLPTRPALPELEAAGPRRWKAGQGPERPPEPDGDNDALPPGVSRSELEAPPPRRWRTGSVQWQAGPDPGSPPERTARTTPDRDPYEVGPAPQRLAVEPAPPGVWATGPARWQAGRSADRAPERTADTLPASDTYTWDRLRRRQIRVETLPPPRPTTRPARVTPADVDQIKRRRRRSTP